VAKSMMGTANQQRAAHTVFKVFQVYAAIPTIFPKVPISSGPVWEILE